MSLIAGEFGSPFGFLIVVMMLSGCRASFVTSRGSVRRVHQTLPMIFRPLVAIGGEEKDGLWSTDRVPSSVRFRRLSTLSQTFMAKNRDNARGDLTRTAIRRMRVAELRDELNQRGLDSSGKRPQLVNKLLEATSEPISPESQPVAGDPTSTASNSPPALHPDRVYVLRFCGHTTPAYGRAGTGLVLLDNTNGKEVWCAQHFSRTKTKVESEYKAILIGLNYARRRGVQHLMLQCDNDVIIRQLKGEYNINKEEARRLYWSVLYAMKEYFASVKMQCISEEENSRALDFAQRALGTRKSCETDFLEEDVEGLESSPLLTPPGPEGSLSSSWMPSSDETYLLQVDGGARGNPGIAGAGMVIYDSRGDEVWCGWQFIKEATNNMAEYSAFLLGLQGARSLGISRLDVECDSMLVVRQVNGSYRVKDAKLKPMHAAVVSEMDSFESIHVNHILRNKNRRADELANQAMDTQDSHTHGMGTLLQGVSESDDVSSYMSSPLPGEKYVLRVDGASRGNSGFAGAGMVIYDLQGNEIWCGSKLIADATCNVAEYSAILLGLQRAKSLGISRILIESGSELVVNQVNGRYKVKSSLIQPLHAAVMKEVDAFEAIRVSYMPRRKNSRADELATQAIDTRDSNGLEEIKI